uniref:Uncharacterized protein n=1 Tax=viral metagenome TaxID=1070528 RepID=A0A6C0JKS3_9ZZZZ
MDLKDAINLNTNFLNFNFSTSTLYNKGQWEEKKFDYGNYYKITYPDDNSDLKLTENVFAYYYNPVYLYIFNKLHSITGLTDIDTNNICGELVIEYEGKYSNKKIYLCVFLKFIDNAPSSNIDQIINMIQPPNDSDKKTSVDLNLALDITKDNQKYVLYNVHSDMKAVIVLTEPILINAYSKIFCSNLTSVTSLFVAIPPNSNLYKSELNEMSEAAKKNPLIVNNKDEIYIDCAPTGESNTNIQTYNIPINSTIDTKINQLEFMKTAVNFFIFILTIIIIYFTIPAMFKQIVINNAIKLFPDTDQAKKRIRSAEIVIIIFFLIFIFGTLQHGFKKNDYTSLTTGLFAFVIMGISISLILNSKLNTDYLTFANTTIVYKDDDKGKSFTDTQDIFALLSSCFNFMISSEGARWPILFLLLLSFTILLTVRYGTSKIDDKKFDTIRWQLLIYIPITASVAKYWASG